MSFETLIYQKEGGVASVVLNRPEVLNVFNVRMRDEMAEVLTAISLDDEVRVLTLSGAGRAFCAGADLTEFGSSPSPTVARRVRFARDVWKLLQELEIPKIAVMQGYAFGSGLELALLCDLRLAAEGTEFALPEARLGLIPAAGATQTLPRAIGSARALDLLLTGRRMGAQEALQAGLLMKVVNTADLATEGQKLADELSALDPRAVRALLQAVRHGADLPLPDALRLESHLASELRNDS